MFVTCHLVDAVALSLFGTGNGFKLGGLLLEHADPDANVFRLASRHVSIRRNESSGPSARFS